MQISLGLQCLLQCPERAIAVCALGAKLTLYQEAVLSRGVECEAEPKWWMHLLAHWFLSVQVMPAFGLKT